MKAVLAREIGHVASGDMVTLTLIQGVVNTLVMFFVRIFGNPVDKTILKNEDGSDIGHFAAIIFAELALGILASTIVVWFLRHCEFRADVAGAHLAGTGTMVAALQYLRSEQGVPVQVPDTLNAFSIDGGLEHGLAGLLTNHPPLGDRIEVLRTNVRWSAFTLGTEWPSVTPLLRPGKLLIRGHSDSRGLTPEHTGP